MKTQTQTNGNGSKKTVLPKEISRDFLTKTAEGYPIIGWTVHWGTNSFTISYGRFCELLKEAGIDPLIARETLPKHAYQRAVRTSKGKGLAPKVLDDRHMAISVITHAEVGASLDVSFREQAKVTYDKSVRDIVVQGQAPGLKDKFELFKTQYVAQQFRTVALRYIKRYCSGIMVKEGGGLYFVPATHEVEFEKLQKLFELVKEETEANADIVPMPVIDSKQARSAMWKSLVGEVTEELARLREDFGGLDGEIKERSLNIRLDRYKKLRTKVEMYENILQGTATDLKTELAELTSLIKKKIID